MIFRFYFESFPALEEMEDYGNLNSGETHLYIDGFFDFKFKGKYKTKKIEIASTKINLNNELSIFLKTNNILN